jgi:peptidoglycan/LPS O-acetylase OafA/YrhL
VLPVVWHHATPRPLPGLAGRGPLGVDLFFAISGFLITTLLLRERRERGAVSVGRFYARRALRILPAYYLVLGLWALRWWLLAPASLSREHFLRSLPYWATYTANWFVDFDVAYPVVFAFAWSLATEEQFYTVWPWLARAPRWAMPVAAAALLGADLAIEQGVLGAGWPELARRMVASIASPICMGALLACTLDSAGGFAVLRRVLGARVSAPLVLVALAALVVDGRAPPVVVQLTMTLLVGACAVRTDHGLHALLDVRPVRWVGTVSYALYLVHVAAITAVKQAFPALAEDAPFVFAVGLAMGLPLSYALHRAVDVPLQPLRRRLRRGGTAVAEVGRISTAEAVHRVRRAKPS